MIDQREFELHVVAAELCIAANESTSDLVKKINWQESCLHLARFIVKLVDEFEEEHPYGTSPERN